MIYLNFYNELLNSSSESQFIENKNHFNKFNIRNRQKQILKKII